LIEGEKRQKKEKEGRKEEKKGGRKKRKKEGFVCYLGPTKVIKHSDGRGRAAPEVGAAGKKKICTNFLKTDHLYVLINSD
jgi:hypothetical protein